MPAAPAPDNRDAPSYTTPRDSIAGSTKLLKCPDYENGPSVPIASDKLLIEFESEATAVW